MEYKFITQPQSESDITKTPFGMFEDEDEMPLNEIPNDLGIVTDAIKAFRTIKK
jgi:hypothetical protein